MRARNYCAHHNTRDHWTLRCMNRCPDLVGCLKRDLQCLRPEASLVLIYRPNVVGMKGRVDLAQPVNRTPDLCPSGSNDSSGIVNDNLRDSAKSDLRVSLVDNGLDRKGINLNQRKDVRYFKPKGEGEPTCIITDAKKHDPQDYLCNKFQTYDMDNFNRNVEELCKFQGKFTPEDDELSPNYKASSESKLKPAHLSVSEDEMDPDLKKIK
ncbi:hypothetical protein TNCV_4467951 [Trichonephila clavipes]|nr:hypothetical protein TNCV_4467951 [Trichonephila clavipes]